MMRLPALLAVVTLWLAMSAPAPAQQDLAAAKDLYTAAKYDEALVVLDRLKEAKPATSDTALAIEQYRAMCLLALNRKAEAEQAIEAVADLDPFYQPAEDDAAPWVRAAFRETRRKVLPAALQRLYGHAKEAYDRKDTAEAVPAFKRVIKILDDPDLTLDKAAQGDMKMVAGGFLDLLQAAASAKPAPAPTPASPSESASVGVDSKAAPPTAPSPGPVAPKVYDAASKDVTPPLPVRRDVPSASLGPRMPPGTAVIVEIIVRENGTIESVVVRESAGKYYDEMVSQAARNWSYRPATRAGQPVKYRMLVKVVIGRTEPPSESTR
jgi:TonB family protein